MTANSCTDGGDRYLAHFLAAALSAKSGIDFRIASMALDAYQEIKAMCDVALREVDEILGIQEPF